MSDPVILQRIDPVPLQTENFSDEFKSWLSVTVDALNETIQTIETALNP